MKDGLSISAALSFHELARPAFQLEVDLTFEPGTTAVLGPSGSGKSTLLALVAGKHRPTRGRITVGNRVLSDREGSIFLPPRARRVSLLFQSYLLFPHLSALDNVAFGLPRGAAGQRRALEWLERVGAGHLAPRHPTTMSGGEQQRVAIARALATPADVVLLDEPTAALDHGTRAEILDLIRAAQRESGVPFLHVCHSPSEATRVGDRAVVLAEGRVVQEGRPLEVLSAPRSLATARVGGFENTLAATVREHRERDGITLVQAGELELEMAYYPVPTGTVLDVALRAEDIIVSREPVHGTSARNLIGGTVQRVQEESGRVELEVATPALLRVSVTPVTRAELDLRPGIEVYLLIKARAIHPLE